MRYLRTLILIISVTSLTSFGQLYELSNKGNEILIKGTSNLHDWQMNLIVSNCEAEFDKEGFQLRSIKKVNFSCEPSNIRSDYNLMDRKTYAALKADVYKVIKFNLLSKTELKSDDREFKGSLRGNLYIAGITNEVEVPFTGILNSDNTINVEGSFELRMSDFDISPPTAILGTLKTGDKITISFSLKLVNKT
jgi:hypothetical protein